jgi:hypothetical protein
MLIIVKRSTCSGEGTLVAFLENGILTDSQGRIGSIVANHQFQFDGPPSQAGAIYDAGWAVCANGYLALGSSEKFYQCRSGGFYNIYDKSIGSQCQQVMIEILPCDGSSSSTGSHTSRHPTSSGTTTTPWGGSNQISDGQIQTGINQITDGQIQTGINQIADGQIQSGGHVSQIKDGQLQTGTNKGVSQIADGQIQTSGVSQIADGQIQARDAVKVTEVVTEVDVVKQNPDGEIVFPSASEVAKVAPATNTGVVERRAASAASVGKVSKAASFALGALAVAAFYMA